MTDLTMQGDAARRAARFLMTASTDEKNRALFEMAKGLLAEWEQILAANEQDLAAAREAGMGEALLDRLALNRERIEGMAQGVEQVAALPDPVGEIVEGSVRPNGLQVQKVRVPLGVIGMIYEARPNVTSDAAALCLKAGNAVILRGGKEAICSNRAVVGALGRALERAGLPAACVQLVQDTSRESANAMMRMNGVIDVLIPRGGAGLIRSVVENARVPVIETGVGNCHIFVDESADLEQAAAIVFNAKTTRPSVCNAAETLLVHGAIAQQALPRIAAELGKKNVQLRGCARTCAILPQAVPAVESDWEEEFLDFVLAVKVVEDFDEAIAHIARYSTGHSDAILAHGRFGADLDQTRDPWQRANPLTGKWRAVANAGRTGRAFVRQVRQGGRLDSAPTDKRAG